MDNICILLIECSSSMAISSCINFKNVTLNENILKYFRVCFHFYQVENQAVAKNILFMDTCIYSKFIK